jgi:hypothetical protein
VIEDHLQLRSALFVHRAVMAADPVEQHLRAYPPMRQAQLGKLRL